MAVAAGDTIRLTFRGLCFGQRIIVDYGYRVTVGNAGLTTAQVLNELNTQVFAGGGNDIMANYLLCLPPQYQALEIRSQVIKPVRSAYQSQVLVGIVGTNANASTVACDSGALTRRTALAGRNQVSVLKIGPLPDASSAAGLLTAGARGQIAVWGVDTIKPLLLPVSTVQLVSTILDPLGFSTGRDLTNIFVQAESRVMTRRVVGRGE